MIELKVEGMTCQHCLRAVEQAVASVPEAGRTEVTMGNVRFERSAAAERLRTAIEEEGYRVVEATDA